MAKHKRIWNQNKYVEYLKAGRGQGEGSTYLPWISIQSFSSKGIVSRVFGYKTQRVHHLLSRNELYYFYLLEWSDKVLDIREQFPLLDIGLAVDIASEAGIKYPKDNVSGFPYVLTCDFMITTKNGIRARTIKNSKDLYNGRTREKLEIERRYWKACNVEWQIVTEKEIPIDRAKFIEQIYTAAELPAFLMIPEYFEEILLQLRSLPVQIVAGMFDEQYGFPIGSGLKMIKHLFWSKKISLEEVNLTALEAPV